MRMPADVVERVEKMSDNSAVNRLMFGDRHNTEEALDEDGDAISLRSDEPDESENDTDPDTSSTTSIDDQDALVDAHDGGENHPRSSDARDRQITLKREPHYGENHAKEEPEIEGAAPSTERANEKNVGVDTTGPDWHPTMDEADPGNSKEEALETAQQSARVRFVHEYEGYEDRRSGDGNKPSEHADENAGDDDEHDTKVAGNAIRPAGVQVDDSKLGDDGVPGDALADEMDQNYGKRTRAGMWKRKRPKFDCATCKVMTEGGNQAIIAPAFDASQLAGHETSLSPLICTVLTQYGIKKGLRGFGKKGDDAVNAEMQQLHDLRFMRPTPPASLCLLDRQDALNYLIFLKRKRHGRIKGRGCADGRKQRNSAMKGEASSPTISTEAVFLLLTIAAKEGRDVMTIDIPVSFLQTELKGERVHV